MSFIEKYFYVLLSGIAVLFVLAGIKYMNAINGTEVVVHEKILNVETVKFMSDVKAVFVLENAGKRDLKIFKVTPDCQCVVAEWDKSSIPPGQSTEVKVEYHGNVTGYFQHNVVVEVNAENSPVILTLRGKAV